MAVTVNEIIPKITERPKWEMTSDKFKATFTVAPMIGGFAFHEISVSAGKLPQELNTMFTNAGDAIKVFKEWEARQKKSAAVKRDDNTAAREKQKAE